MAHTQSPSDFDGTPEQWQALEAELDLPATYGQPQHEAWLRAAITVQASQTGVREGCPDCGQLIGNYHQELCPLLLGHLSRLSDSRQRAAR